MDISSLGQSSKDGCINYEQASNNITSKIKSKHQKTKQCCFDIASRKVIISQPSHSQKDYKGYNLFNSKNIIKVAENGDTKYLEEFLAEKPPYEINKVYDSDGQYTLLHIAMIENQFNTVKYLVEKGASLNCTPNLLTIACSVGDARSDRYDIVHYLLTQGVNPPKDRKDMMRDCVANGKIKTFKILVSHGIKPTFSNGIYHFRKCLESSNIEFLRALLENNLKVDKEYHGLQLIHIVCQQRYPSIEVIKLLLEYGANPNAQAKSGKATPLHFLLANEYLPRLDAVLKFLVDNGADDSLKGKINSKYKNDSINKHAKTIINEGSKHRAIELVPTKNKDFIQGMIQYHKSEYLNNKALKKQKTGVPEKQKKGDPKKQPRDKQSFLSRLKSKSKVTSAYPLEDLATLPSAPPHEDAILPEYSLKSNLKQKVFAGDLNVEVQPSAPPLEDLATLPSAPPLEDLATLPSAPPLEDLATLPSAPPRENEVLPAYSLEPNLGERLITQYINGELEAPPAYDEIYNTELNPK